MNKNNEFLTDKSVNVGDGGNAVTESMYVLKNRNDYKSKILTLNMIEEVESLALSFEEMERNGKVNLNSSLPIIEKLARNLILFREKLEGSKDSTEKIFSAYHSSFVISVVLQNMKERLEEAEVTNDNPIIALNSLKVIPNMKNILLRFDEKKEANINNATNLQETALKNNLFNINPNRLKSADEVLRSIIKTKEF